MHTNVGPSAMTWWNFEINSRNAPWIKNSKTWRFWFIYSDALFKNLTRKKCVSVSEFKTAKHRMSKIWSGAVEGRLIFRCSLTWDEVLQPACCCFELKVTGFHLALVFTTSLSKVENGVKPCWICKTFWKIQTKLICCIEEFNVFAGNWTLVLCERNQSLSCKIF